MKITGLEILHCDAGWRNYSFLKLTTTGGIVGWSEFDEEFGSSGVGNVIARYAARIVGASVGDHERLYQELAALTRPAGAGVTGQALGAIENAMLDAKAKALSVPCYTLLGGRIRDRVPVYWSSCATWRINHPAYYKPPIVDLDGVRAAGAEATAKGFRALKTNIFFPHEGRFKAWRPGFADPLEPGLNVTPELIGHIVKFLTALKEGAGPNAQLLLDLNFNVKPEGLNRILRAIAHLDLFWLEVDCRNPHALALARANGPHPISSGETLIGLKEWLPYLTAQSFDVGILDIVWNGAWQGLKIAAAADAHDINVAPHNFYGHLCTLMSAHFAAAIPNLRIMEVDIDRIPWDDELFTHKPQIEDGHIKVPDRPGWGAEPIEAALRAHPPKERHGQLTFRFPAG